MAKFKITLYTDDTLAKKILKGWQYKLYLIKLRGFLRLIEAKLKKYKSEAEKGKKIFIDESDDMKYLEEQQRKLEAFLYSDSSELQEESAGAKHLINERVIQKLNKTARKFTSTMKDKSIRLALGGDNVLGFFGRLGIGIVWEIEKDERT